MATLNQGERDELLIVLTILRLRKERRGFLDFTHIDSVRSRTRQYELPRGEIDPTSWEGLSDDDLKSLAARAGVEKAGPKEKADVIVNGIGISLKSSAKSPPAIVNHTSRPGWEKICERVGARIEDIDPLIDHYWELRLRRDISEDVPNHSPHSPFRGAFDVLAPVLSYFLLKGNPTAPSTSPAERVLDSPNPMDPSTWSLHTPEEVIRSMWDGLVFSVRAKKGMPKGFPVGPADAVKRTSIARWSRQQGGHFYGALHVRVRKRVVQTG